VSVVGGENGIDLWEVRNTTLDGVSVSGSKLDGIHVRLSGVHIRNCSVDMLGNELGQGIDISFGMGYGMSMVEGCTVVGGMDGIVTHSTMSEIMNNRVSRTSMRGISMTEMSMGMIAHNEVRDARGVGILCNDRSMCMIERNTVVDTLADNAGGDDSRSGYGVLASFQSEADLRGNELTANPVPMGSVTNSELRTTH
jgi:hypothetical protein